MLDTEKFGSVAEISLRRVPSTSILGREGPGSGMPGSAMQLQAVQMHGQAIEMAVHIARHTSWAITS